jgi:hypothetical protein
MDSRVIFQSVESVTHCHARQVTLCRALLCAIRHSVGSVTGGLLRKEKNLNFWEL